MSETQLTNFLGWLQEATYGTDPNPNSNTHYKLGKNVLGNFPRVKRAVQVNHNNNYQPSERITTTHIIQDVIAFEPVNSLALKYVFAQADGTGISEAAGVFTVDPSAIAVNGQRASWTWRTDLGNSTENLRDHYLGNMATRYQEGMNFIGGSDQRLVAGLDYIGQKRVTPATDVSNPPIYPDIGTTNDNESFKKDGNTVLTYDGDTMLPQVVQYNMTISNEPQSHPVDGQRHVEQVTTGNQTYGLTLNVRRAGGFSKELHVDYRDQLNNDTTGKTLVFQIYNTASLYKKYTFTDCAITDLVENIIIDANFVEHPTYQVTFVPLTVVPEFKDGLNKTTFYNL